MTNVVPLHAPKEEPTPLTATLADFVELLNLNELTVQGEKGLVNTWKGISLKMWTDAFMMTEQGYSDDPEVVKKVPMLLSATQTQAPDFASHLFISLLHHKNYSLLMTPRTTKMLFDAGANWNTALYEKTLAQEIVDCYHMPITLKIEARRAIQEHNRNKTVVQLVKKL